jgi:hypothetical protein
MAATITPKDQERWVFFFIEGSVMEGNRIEQCSPSLED